MYALAGKVAVVTGAGSGIGRALAQRLAGEGCHLALADIDEDKLRRTAESLPGQVLTQVLDVSRRDDVYAFAAAVRARFGSAHVIINNAGVAVSQNIRDLSWEDFEWLMGINFWGVTYGTKAFLPLLLEQNEGVVVNISSVFGLIAWPAQGAYNAAKFAVRGFTECLRLELEGTGVRAISVHPGGIKTNIARAARFYVAHDGNRDHGATARQFEQMARTTPERAAQVIVEGLKRGRERILIGPDARLIDLIQRLRPVHYWRSIARLAERMAR